MTTSDDEWLKPPEAAALLRMTTGTLAQLRHSGRGPVFAKVPSGRVLYEREDLSRWVKANKFSRTGQREEAS